MASVLETDRLMLRQFSTGDAQLVLDLLTDPDFVRYVGDRGVRTVDDARKYIEERLMAGYALNGFGFYVAQRKSDRVPVGMCGLVKREWLDDVDVGYALLPAHRGAGYALEGVRGVLALARATFGLARVVAIVHPKNTDSIRVLERAGMALERPIKQQDDAPELVLYARSVDRPDTPT